VPVRDGGPAAIGAADFTVRAVPIAQAVPDEATARLVRALTDARIIVVTGAETGAQGDGVFIGIAHQRVFESWERARQIIAEHRDFFRIRDEVETQYQRWAKAGRASALLLAKGVPLAEAQRIVKAHAGELPPEIRAYVTTSSRRAQRFTIFMGATAAIFAVLAVLAFNLKLAADRNFETAQANQLVAETNRKTAEANFGVARETASNMIAATAQGLRDLKGISVTTIDIVLNAIDRAVQKLKDTYPDNPLVDLSRAAARFEFAKTYQATGNRALAVKVAMESLDIRKEITRYDGGEAADDAAAASFEAVPADWRWDLSNSLELVGDLAREDNKIGEARESFLKALRIRTRLVAAAPEKDDWALGVSLSYVRLGDLEQRADLAAARSYYELAVRNAASFFLRNPNSERWQRELSFGFNKVGDVKLLPGSLALSHERPHRFQQQPVHPPDARCPGEERYAAEAGCVLYAHPRRGREAHAQGPARRHGGPFPRARDAARASRQ
jgi:Novel STAND NTPase 1